MDSIASLGDVTYLEKFFPYKPDTNLWLLCVCVRLSREDLCLTSTNYRQMQHLIADRIIFWRQILNARRSASGEEGIYEKRALDDKE